MVALRLVGGNGNRRSEDRSESIKNINRKRTLQKKIKNKKNLTFVLNTVSIKKKYKLTYLGCILRFIYEGVREGFSQGHVAGSYIILMKKRRRN